MERETKLPQGFTTKKMKIVQALTLPEKQYFDLSPKGSVDEGIRDLVKLLNDMDGIVTTSSCAGRTSVFLEGQKTQESPADDQNTNPNGQALQAAVPGGKGLGGHWLYVSHEVVDLDSEVDLFSKFGLSSRELGQEVFLNANSRLVKFQFEPMILHIMTASLHHAKPLLAAAINAGMRESGVQSLKALENSDAYPMVAIRSTGLAHSSIIGYLDESSGQVISLVDEIYLRLMVAIAQKRHKANLERIERFKVDLLTRSVQTNEMLGKKHATTKGRLD